MKFNELLNLVYEIRKGKAEIKDFTNNLSGPEQTDDNVFDLENATQDEKNIILVAALEFGSRAELKPENASLEIAKLAVEAGAEIDYTFNSGIHKTTILGHYSKIKGDKAEEILLWALNEGADHEKVKDEFSHSRPTAAVLADAIYNEHKKFAKALIEKNPTSIDIVLHGRYALGAAFEKKDWELFKLLTENGTQAPNIDLIKFYKALFKEDEELAKLFVKKNQKKFVENLEKITPLSNYGHEKREGLELEEVEFLLDNIEAKELLKHSLKLMSNLIFNDKRKNSLEIFKAAFKGLTPNNKEQKNNLLILCLKELCLLDGASSERRKGIFNYLMEQNPDFSNEFEGEVSATVVGYLRIELKRYPIDSEQYKSTKKYFDRIVDKMGEDHPEVIAVKQKLYFDNALKKLVNVLNNPLESIIGFAGNVSNAVYGFYEKHKQGINFIVKATVAIGCIAAVIFGVSKAKPEFSKQATEQITKYFAEGIEKATEYLSKN